MIITVNLTEVTCYRCGMHFALDRRFNEKCRETGESFYCPSGHSQAYTETELTRLKRENQSLQSENYWEKRQHAATKGKLTKFKNRVSAGVCPCCNRTFQNLSRHMNGQHPEFNDERT